MRWSATFLQKVRSFIRDLQPLACTFTSNRFTQDSFLVVEHFLKCRGPPRLATIDLRTHRVRLKLSSKCLRFVLMDYVTVQLLDRHNLRNSATIRNGCRSSASAHRHKRRLLLQLSRCAQSILIFSIWER